VGHTHVVREGLSAPLKTHLLMNMITHQTKSVELHSIVCSPVLQTENQTIEEEFFYIRKIKKVLTVMALPKKMNNSGRTRKN
jgi:hypothetical protein